MNQSAAPGGRRYRGLHDASVAAARQLQALGLRAGDRLLVLGENCVALGVWVLAASRLDAWTVVANARRSGREIDPFIDHAQPRRVLCTPDVSPEAASHAARHGAENLDWSGLGQSPIGALNEGTLPGPCFDDPRDQVGCVLYTSGTSGVPKGVMLTYANMMFTATSAAKLPAMTPDDLSHGLTERAPTIAQTRVGKRRADCAVGHPIRGVEVRLVAAGGGATPAGDIGELWARTPGLMKGYDLSPDLTAQVIDAEGGFNTGDLVRTEPDGALSVVGRSKELIIRSGLNVYPVEVEQAINAHPEVIQSAVVGRAVKDNEEVVAFVERAAGSSLDEAGLCRHLRASLAPYKFPREIRFMPLRPAAPTGKLLKGVMKTRAQQSADARPAPAAS